MISNEFKDWINEKVLEYLPKNSVRNGKEINCRCPICGDSKKNSMKKRGYYSLDKATYFCHNQCGHISGMKFLEFLSGSDYEELKQEYFKIKFDGNHFRTFNTSENKTSDGIDIFNLKSVIKTEWKSPLSDKAKAYLEKRMILQSPFCKEKFYSYYSKSGDEYILIPWIINGVECYFQLNDFEKHNKNGMKYIFPKNKEKMIYGLDNVDVNFPYLFITEGVYDSLFIPNGICVGGKYLTNIQKDIISKRFGNNFKIIYNFDNDGPGFKQAEKIISESKSINYGFFKWFSDNTKEKDINDYVLSKNNINIFSDKKQVESCIVDPLIMKVWLMRKGYFNNDTSKQKRSSRKIFQFDDRKIQSIAS